MRYFVLLLAAALLFVATLAAHHSVPAEYDITKTITYRGTVDNVTWMNPHATFTLKIAAADGKSQNWVFEMAPPNPLKRTGWKQDSLKPGDVVTVTALAAKDGSPRGSAVTVTWSDGHSLACKDSWDWSAIPADATAVFVHLKAK